MPVRSGSPAVVRARPVAAGGGRVAVLAEGVVEGEGGRVPGCSAQPASSKPAIMLAARVIRGGMDMIGTPGQVEGDRGKAQPTGSVMGEAATRQDTRSRKSEFARFL